MVGGWQVIWFGKFLFWPGTFRTVGHISVPRQWTTSVCATSWSEMNLESPTVPNLDPSVNYEETLAGNTRNTWSLISVQKPHYIDGPNGV